MIVDGADQRSRKVRAQLAARVEDQFIPMGLTGASHHLLLRDESAAEIKWAVSNLWSTGCTDGGMKPPAFVLLSDKNAQQPPNDGGVPIAISGLLDGSPVFALADGTRQRCLHVIDSLVVDTSSAQAGSRSIARALKKIGRVRSVKPPLSTAAIQIVLGTPEDVSHLLQVLDGIEEFCGRGLGEVVALPAPESWQPASGPVRPRGRPQAADVEVAAAAAELRKRRTSKINRRRTLEIVAGDRHENVAGPQSPGHREFVASMMGDVALAGPSADALFSGGRFRGFRLAPGDRFPPLTSCLLAATGETPRECFEPTTAFSFESDEARGVRIIEHLTQSDASGNRSDETQVVSDYSFVREKPLLISTHALLVSAHRVPVHQELLHLTLPIGRNATFRTRAAYPDGWSTESVLGDSNEQSELHGSRFQILFEDEILAIAFLTRSGLPLIVSVGVHRVPELVLVIGGRFSPSSVIEPDARSEFAMVWGSGAEGVEEMDRLLTGRLPAAIQRELLNGPTASVPDLTRQKARG
jgi:hypothetical protein